MSFAEQLKTGQAGESAIARWLISRGHSVLPVYEKIVNEGKGPQLFTGLGQLISPDLMSIRNGKPLWIEAKHKDAFTWYRIKQVFETGIDMRHYNDYLRVSEQTGVQLWLMFLHKGGAAKDSPPSPSGLYAGEIRNMMNNESHRSSKYGSRGMVYWTRKCDGGPLAKIGGYEDVCSV